MTIILGYPERKDFSAGCMSIVCLKKWPDWDYAIWGSVKCKCKKCGKIKKIPLDSIEDIPDNMIDEHIVYH